MREGQPCRGLQIGLQACFQFHGINLQAGPALCKKHFPLAGVAQKQRKAFVVIFRAQCGLLDAPKVPDGNVCGMRQPGKWTTAARWTQQAILVDCKVRINGVPVCKTERFPVGMPPEFLISEVNSLQFFIMRML